ncbi:sodium:solute symporter family protein [Pseudonocardia sp. TRM90224]|uniref:sodium:solute symporter family protein n=1 Tax=Pseudonocardia sp. TRM90224 TaxID=2812678 RepID=UPI001E3433DC|nr:sodium:solute symporter [Pseudonocardia sp. TRM90224]
MEELDSALTLIAVLAGTSLLALAARRFHRRSRLPDMRDWALADSRYGAVITWFLLGGSVFTAYTFIAVPGRTFGVGALGFFSLAYTGMLAPILFVLLPRMWAAARRTGSVTIADHVRAKYDSPGLMLAVALTGMLATMPYVALQLVGVRAVLFAVGLYPAGIVGDLALTAVFAVLAVATFNTGLRAPALISVAKGVLVFGATFGFTLAVLREFDGFGPMFAAASERAVGSPHVDMLIQPEEYLAFATLALGSALALPMYPHVLTAAFAAKGPETLRRAVIGIPAWTMVLGLFGLLGVAALAAGIAAPPGNAEVAAPLLVAHMLPAVASGAVFGAIAVGALVPAAVMSVALAALFTRNVYVEFFAPHTTPKGEVRVARWVSLLAKVAALGFVFGLRDQVAINLQLLGSLWILQTLPTVAIGLFTNWLHPRALLAGWAVGMAGGTWLAVAGGFSSLVHFPSFSVSVGMLALVLNLVVAAGLTMIFDAAGLPRAEQPRGAAGVD